MRLRTVLPSACVAAALCLAGIDAPIVAPVTAQAPTPRPTAPPAPSPAASAPAVAWPGGARMALSLSFDDARESQVTTGLPVFARHEAKVTLYVVPSAVAQRVEAWKRAVAAGHEIGSHSVTHSCSGNFPFARAKALEDHSLPRMRAELVESNRRIAALLGVTPRTFAYPCGQTFVGRGTATRSYVPIVAELYLAGRGWLDEAANDPAFVDLAQVLGVEMDGKDFAGIRPLLDEAARRGAWLVLAGHDIGVEGRQVTRVAMLDALLAYAKDPAHGIWLATVGEVSAHIARTRAQLK